MQILPIFLWADSSTGWTLTKISAQICIICVNLNRLCGSCAGLEGEAHALVGMVPVADVAVVAIGHAAHVVADAATATTQHAAFHARVGAGRIHSGRVLVVIAAIPVVAPFPHVAAHVVEPQLVGCLGGHVLRAITGVALAIAVAGVVIPGHVVEVVAAGELVALALVATSGRKLPLGLGGQAEGSTRELVELGDELLALVPAHVVHGALQPLRGAGAGVVAHHRQPQFLGDLGLAYPIIRVNNLVFIVLTFLIELIMNEL